MDIIQFAKSTFIVDWVEEGAGTEGPAKTISAEVPNYQVEDQDNDLYWAQHHPQLELEFGGQWVVPYRGEIISHGSDPSEVFKKASQVVPVANDRLVVCAVPHPNTWGA